MSTSQSASVIYAKHPVPIVLESLNDETKALLDKANKIVTGRQVRIVSSYNGQQFGRSRKPLTGKVFVVRGAYLDPHHGAHLWLEGEHLSIKLDEVEWL